MKMILNDKQSCIDSIAKVLERTAAWRKAIAVNFPDDPRNMRAAGTLEKLAVDAANLTDEQWCDLKPHFSGWGSGTWRNGLSQAARSVWLPSPGEGFQFLCQSPCPTAVAFERRVSRIENRMSFYDRDPTVPFWRSNVDVDSLFTAHAHRPDRAQAWLRYRNVAETCTPFGQAVTMRGCFEAGSLGAHTFQWTFTPSQGGEPAIVLPVYDQGKLIDLIAIARHDYRIWGCVTGSGQYVGRFINPLSVHDTPYSWLLSNCDGLLPLSKAFFPLMQFAPSIVARDSGHAWEIAHQAFIYPAERFGLDCNAAEQAAFDRISFEDAE